jgi:hypothetical protein
MPRKTLFKPIVRPNMLKNPLWCEVFLDKDNEENESEGDVEMMTMGSHRMTSC